jgi:hypothetical protein
VNNGTAVKDPKEETVANKSIQTNGKGYLERKMAKQKEKTIRATIKVEIPYSNDVLNNGTLLDKEIRKVIDKTEHISCSLRAGYLDSDAPVLK